MNRGVEPEGAESRLGEAVRAFLTPRPATTTPRDEELLREGWGTLLVARFAARMSRPALIVHDRADDEIPVENGLLVAAAWPGAKVLVTERYGHRRILLAKEVVREVVGFLKAEGSQLGVGDVTPT